MEDNLALYHQTDSLELLIRVLHSNNLSLSGQIDSLRGVIHTMDLKVAKSKNDKDSLLLEQINLNRTILANKQEMLKLNTLLEQKSQLLRDKDYQLSETELELKDLKSTSELNQVKLEGKLDAHNSKLAGKETEIAYLKKSNEEKDHLIKEKTAELSTYYREKDNSLHIIDSLSRALNQKELDYVRTSERLKIIEPQYNVLIAKQNAAANKKKKIRFIQGASIKSYRTPDWQMSPSSATAPNDYVITNKNAGKIDFDYITGISLSLYDLTEDNNKFTSDAGIFVGIGGQNLFKNFYIGPSFKVFDFIHLNTGFNFAEYEQLKPGFKEGDHPGEAGLSSVLVNKWKTNFFIGFTVDLDLLRTIFKKS